MEESKLTNEEDNSKESTPKIDKEIKNEDIAQQVSSELLEKVSNQDFLQQKANLNTQEIKPPTKNSLFERILNDGFDGISTNPNHKMLALLIILLINLSVFLAIGNIGKAYLRNAGIMWLKKFFFFNYDLYIFDSLKKLWYFHVKLINLQTLNKNEPENPVVYLSNLIKKLDVNKRNGFVALAIVNLLVIFLFKLFLQGSGLLSWLLNNYSALSNCLANLNAFLIIRNPP